jgi:hypothetical protein
MVSPQRGDYEHPVRRYRLGAQAGVALCTQRDKVGVTVEKSIRKANGIAIAQRNGMAYNQFPATVAQLTRRSVAHNDARPLTWADISARA